MLATDLTGEGIEVAMFSDEEGSAFLQNLLARKSYPPEEKKSAESLSHELGGLPLALNLMGKQLKKSKGRKNFWKDTSGTRGDCRTFRRMRLKMCAMRRHWPRHGRRHSSLSSNAQQASHS
jgi:hypothetical protein